MGRGQWATCLVLGGPSFGYMCLGTLPLRVTQGDVVPGGVSDCPFHLLHFHSPHTPALSSCVRHVKPHSYHELSSKSMNSMLKKSPALPCSPPFSVTPGLSRWFTPLHTHAHAYTYQCPRATGEAKSEGIGLGKSPPLLDKILNPAQLLVEWFAHPDLAL